MRALVPVAIVAILAVTFLIVWLTWRRREIKRERLRGLERENRDLRALVARISGEADLQLAAGNASHGYTADLIANFSHKEPTP